MARYIPDDPLLHEAPNERSALYWKKAALSFDAAYTSTAPGVRSMWLKMGRAFAAIATGLERAPVVPERTGSESRERNSFSD